MAEGQDPIWGIIDSRKLQFEQLLPKGMSVDRFLMGAKVAIGKNPQLRKCRPLSLLAAMLQGAELGLDVSGALQQAALVPYKEECQLQVMYQGLVELARRSRLIRTMEAVVVYSKEYKPGDMSRGLTPKLEHFPLPPSQRGDPIAAYAVATLDSGEKQFDWMWKEEIEAIRDRVKNWEQKPWKSDPGEMWKKTAVKRLCKLLPKSPELAAAIAHDNEMEGVVDGEVTGREEGTTPTSMERAKRRLQESSGIDMDFGAIPTPEAVPTAEEQEEIRSREQKQ